MQILNNIQRRCLFATISLMLLSMLSYGQVNPATTKLSSTPSLNRNFIITNTIKRSGVSDMSQLPDPFLNEMAQSVQYLDGLGRLIQNIETKGSPNGNDIVSPLTYDDYGRESIKYLPYVAQSGSGAFKADAINMQSQFYGANGWDTSSVRTQFPFSIINFENSAVNRPLENGAPGSVWQPSADGIINTTVGHTQRITYATNNSSIDTATGTAVVLYYLTMDGAGNRLLNVGNSRSMYYPAGELTIKIIRDENCPAVGRAGTTEEYTNKKGQMILTRRFNIKTSEGIGEVLSTYYVYDELGLLGYVLTPGATPDDGDISYSDMTEMCYLYNYDGRNRLIEKKQPGKDWEAMVYNKIDKLVLTQDANQNYLSNPEATFYKYDALGRTVMTGTYRFHDVTPGTWFSYYLQDMADGEEYQWEERNYNDLVTGYTARTLSEIQEYHTGILTINYYDDYNFPGGNTYPHSASLKTRGKLTGTRTNVLGTNDMLLSLFYYDDYGRLIKEFKQHYQSGSINSGNYDEITNTYNFEGAIIATTRIHHNVNTDSTVIAQRTNYDQVGRTVQRHQKINNNVEVLISHNKYNELGQLKGKALYNDLQQTNYKYNERGWLKNSLSNQFSFKLGYEDNSHPQYNGNISSQLWGSGSTLNNTFNYEYDNLDRLIKGANVDMTEVIAYDKMGNIDMLIRNDTTRGYVYNYGVRLERTIGGPETGEYDYDYNGNSLIDVRHNQQVTYNILNLPATIPGLNLSFTYDALGRKLKKVSGSNLTDYIDGIQYHNGSIEFIQNEEGIARNNGGSYSFEFNLKDHLGNVRYTFGKNPVTQQLERLQSDDYFPFGLRKSRNPVSLNNKYLYNGKELQEELGQYDYGARFYDPVIARWTTVDPSAEQGGQESLTPYQYGMNNPIRYDDPDGRCPTCLTAIGGALIGGGIELGGQLLSGKSLENVDWADVGVEVLKGGLIGSGVGAAYLTAAEVGGVAVKASFDLTAGEGGNKNVFNGQKSVGSAIFDAGADVVAGKIAGAVGKKITGGFEKGLQNSISAESKAAKGLIKAENAFNKVTDGGKDMFGAKAMIAGEKLGVAQSTSQAARKAVVRSQMATAASKSAVSSAIKNGAQNTVVDKVKNFFGL